jgi:UDP-N-acetylmuramate: L-alanyl-gamma-D-glutamyl-meso-diaminopimelate ligase
MHNSINIKGYKVTGSDDAIFEPSQSRLDKKECCL